MRASWRVVIAVVLLGLAALMLAPAALLEMPLASRTGQRVHFIDAAGSWWHGCGVIATSDGQARMPLAWRVAFVPLLRGALAVELRADDPGMPTGTLVLRDGTLDGRDFHMLAPAALVPALVPALKGVALRGAIDVAAPSFAWRRGAAVGTFDVRWEPAGFGAAGLTIDLGRVSVHGTPKDGGVIGTVRNEGGDLAVDGRIDARAGTADVSLELTPAAHASDALRAMLPLLGRPDASGRVQVAWRADWR